MVVKAASLFIHSSLLSINLYHAQSSFLAPHSTFIEHTFHTVHPSCSSQPHTSHIGSNYSLHQPVLFHVLNIFKLPQHAMFCSTSQLSRNTSSASDLLVSHLVHKRYSHTYSRPLISIAFNLLLSASIIPHASVPYTAAGTITPWYDFLFTLLAIVLQLNILFISLNTFCTSLIQNFTSVYFSALVLVFIVVLTYLLTYLLILLLLLLLLLLMLLMLLLLLLSHQHHYKHHHFCQDHHITYPRPPAHLSSMEQPHSLNRQVANNPSP